MEIDAVVGRVVTPVCQRDFDAEVSNVGFHTLKQRYQLRGVVVLAAEIDPERYVAVGVDRYLEPVPPLPLESALRSGLVVSNPHSVRVAGKIEVGVGPGLDRSRVHRYLASEVGNHIPDLSDHLGRHPLHQSWIARHFPERARERGAGWELSREARGLTERRIVVERPVERGNALHLRRVYERQEVCSDYRRSVALSGADGSRRLGDRLDKRLQIDVGEDRPLFCEVPAVVLGRIGTVSRLSGRTRAYILAPRARWRSHSSGSFRVFRAVGDPPPAAHLFNWNNCTTDAFGLQRLSRRISEKPERETLVGYAARGMDALASAFSSISLLDSRASM